MDNDDNNQISADDALEGDETMDDTSQKLEEDYESPAAPPDDVIRKLPPDHPLTDTGTDAHEIYDEGSDGATDVDAHHEEPHS